VTVTVAMPYYGAAQYVERAVRSVLAQTYRDFRLVIVGDGEDVPIIDERVTVYRLPENRGTYFALQLILEASPDAWHAPIGADDWLGPTHLEELVALRKTAVAMATCWIHQDDKPPMVQSIGREGWHVGIFAADRLRAIGGYDPSARVSQDTHVLKLLDDHGGYYRHRSENPTYHIRRRPDSLTTAVRTGMRSTFRAKARARDSMIRARCRKLDVAGVRAYRASQVPPQLRAELDYHVGRLHDHLVRDSRLAAL